MPLTIFHPTEMTIEPVERGFMILIHYLSCHYIFACAILPFRSANETFRLKAHKEYVCL